MVAARTSRAHPVGALLGDGPAEGDPEDVEVGVAECGDDTGNDAGDRGHPVRQRPSRGCPDTGCVEGDRLDPVGEQLTLEWLPHPTVATQAHDEQQWAPLASDGDGDVEPVDVDDVVAGGGQPGAGHP
jgi:hypothetical protein